MLVVIQYYLQSSVTDLDQIRWVFDGGKSPVDFQANLTRAVEDLPLTPEIATKFGFEDALELRNVIIESFDDIFILVD